MKTGTCSSSRNQANSAEGLEAPDTHVRFTVSNAWPSPAAAVGEDDGHVQPSMRTSSTGRAEPVTRDN